MDAPAIHFARSVDGVSLPYTTFGEGPPLLFVGSMGLAYCTAHERPRRFLQGIGQGCRLVAMELRGTGAPEGRSNGLTFSALLDDIDSVLTVVAPEGPAILWGDAFFSMLAVTYAVRHPERVAGLILWCPSAAGSDVFGTPASRTIVGPGSSDWATFVTAISAFLCGWDDAEAARILADLTRAAFTADALQALNRVFARVDVSESLIAVDCPTLVLHREGVQLPAAESARALAAAVSGAQFRQLHGRALCAWAGEVEEVIQATRTFIDDVLQRKPSRMIGGDAGTVRTVLFTDLAASTATTQRLGDAAAQDLVRAHNGIVRTALGTHAGHEIKHTGDGIMAWFPAASNALDCAHAIQAAVVDLANPDLSVKIGVNAGEPIAEEDDLYGTAVQIAARVTDQAGPGEIVCTNVVRELVAGKGYVFHLREPAVLKGVEEPVRLFTLLRQDA